ncbi:hypothetical protein EDB19DRAFT_2025376 [Suillus lakei]|nr:hypothetical protein EDB19DRAFT_2025376 [Suillus lakei]
MTYIAKERWDINAFSRSTHHVHVGAFRTLVLCRAINQHKTCAERTATSEAHGGGWCLLFEIEGGKGDTERLDLEVPRGNGSQPNLQVFGECRRLCWHRGRHNNCLNLRRGNDSTPPRQEQAATARSPKAVYVPQQHPAKRRIRHPVDCIVTKNETTTRDSIPIKILWRSRARRNARIKRINIKYQVDRAVSLWVNVVVDQWR